MEQEESVKTIGEYFEVIIRRKNTLIISFLIVGFLGFVLAMKLPPVYRSSATILIEDQQIPQSMVATTITDFADKRIQLIKQRVMTRDRILSIIQKHKIYLDKRDKLVPSELVANFQEDVEITMISANVRDPRGGGIGEATIAFLIAFNDKSAVRAQGVANELVSLFLNENTRVRSQRAAKTTDFIKAEAEKLKKEIGITETKIMDFKAKSGNSLPEMLQSNLASLDRARESFRQADSDIRITKDRIIYLTDSLIRAEKEGGVEQTDQPLSKAAQLRSLKAQYIHFSSLYTAKHPDTIRVKRQIQNMDPGFTGELSELDASKELKQAENELVLLKDKYSESHPDVLKLQQKVNELNEIESQEDNFIKEEDQGNALYITLSSQLRSMQHKIEYLYEFKQELQEKIQQLQDNIDKTPLVEKEYYDLQRMRQTSLNKYAEMESKYRAAKLAQTLEEEQKGETFTLIEPPIAPEIPEKPNRKKITVMGFGLGLGLGLGLVILLELMNEVIRGPKALERITGMQAIVVIPYIETPIDRELRTRRKKIIGVIVIGLLLLGILITHLAIMPLDLIWVKVMLKLGRL